MMNNSPFATASLSALMSMCTPQGPQGGGSEEMSFQKVTLSEQAGAAWMKPVDLDGDGDEDIIWAIYGETGGLFLNSEINAYLQD